MIINGRKLHRLGHKSKWPDDYFQFPGEVQDRRNRWQRYASSGSHIVRLDLRFSILQWPLLVVNICAINFSVANGVQAIALCQPMFESAWLGGLNRANRTIT